MIAVIGAGAMGSVIARDISQDYDVTVIDSSEAALDRLRGIPTFRGDAMDFPGIDTVELAVTALPSEVAPKVINGLVQKGRDIVDISFTDYDPFDIDATVKEKASLYIPHAGFAPGLSNILAGELYYKEGSRDIDVLVGGLQEIPPPPMGYAPTFNASSVIDEYTRPARYLDHGELRTADPLETVEGIEIGGFGRMESFYSDGLATILSTFQGATVIEKTLRYPGHLDKMKFLRDMGYFSSEPVGSCSPREISDGIFRGFVGDYPDLSILEVRSADVPHAVYSCMDHYDREGGVTSMGRMTGYSAAAIARGVLKGKADSTGVYATEWIGRDTDFFRMVLDHLKNRGVSIRRN